MKDLKIKNSIFPDILGLLTIIFLLFQSANTVFGQDTRQLDREKASIQTEKRVALVIGNSLYQKTSTLPNPTNDANDMAEALKELGFEVISGTNQTKQQMEGLIRQFGTRLADTKAIGLFFYAGHGIAQAGTNYLIPIDADIQAEDEIDYSSVNINFVLNKMASANNGFNIVILDACRDNPFARKWRNYRNTGEKGGLARIDAPTGTLIAYATKPGDVASDGDGRNGLYTGSLLKQIRVKNVDIMKMLQIVRADVMKQSGNKQVPFDESSLVGDFYFAGNKTTNPVNTTAINSQPTAPEISTPRMPLAEDVLTKYSKAIGYEKFSNITTLITKGSIEMEGNGKKFTGLIEYYSKKPDSSLNLTVVANLGSMQCFTGNTGWFYEEGSGAKDATAQDVNSSRRSEAIGSGNLALIRQFYPQIIVRGIEKLGNKDVYVLVATDVDGKTETFYIDTVSNLLSRRDFSSFGLDTQQGINVVTETYFEDYVDINGFHIPMTIRQKSANITITFKYDVYQTKYNVPISDSLFKKP